MSAYVEEWCGDGGAIVERPSITLGMFVRGTSDQLKIYLWSHGEMATPAKNSKTCSTTVYVAFPGAATAYRVAR